jgi:hypothetical protein
MNQRRQFVSDVALDVVRQVSADEVDYFPELRDAYFADRKATVEGVGRRNQPVGTGVVVDWAVTIAPVALDVAEHIYDKLLEVVSGAVLTGAALSMKKMRQRFRRRKTELELPEKFTDEQLTAFRTVALARARAAGLPEEQVQLIVDATIEALRRGVR